VEEAAAGEEASEGASSCESSSFPRVQAGRHKAPEPQGLAQGGGGLKSVAACQRDWQSREPCL